jgi:hypothetical protein
MIPIRKSDNSIVWRKSQPGERVLPDVFLTIVYVVQILLRIIWIFDNQSTTQSITVLVLVVAVIPECPLDKRGSELVDTFDINKGKYRLVRDRKVICKAFIWYNGTLGNKSRTILVVGVLLEDAMPML